MPVISFANAKGGAGKTTAALLLATEVAARGKRVTIFDADPQKWISKWYELPNRSSRISVVSEITPSSITEQITDAVATTDYVIIDLEGTENLVVANALSVSDLVVVPIFAVIVALILLGRWLEARSTARAGDAIRALSSRQSATVTLEDGSVVDRAALAVGMRFVVRPGETVATDGRVVDGAAAVDASLVTGESAPVPVTVGDEVLGGTLAAAIELVRKVGGEVTGAASIMELTFLKGRERLDIPFSSLIAYDD